MEVLGQNEYYAYAALLQCLSEDKDVSRAFDRWLYQLLMLLRSHAPGGQQRRDAITSVPSALTQALRHRPLYRELQYWEALLQLVEELAADPWSEVRAQSAVVLGEVIKHFSDVSVFELTDAVLGRLRTTREDWKVVDGLSRAVHSLVVRLGAEIDAALASSVLQLALQLVGHEQLQIRKIASQLAVRLREHLDLQALVAALNMEVRADVAAFSEEHCRSIEGVLMIFAGLLEAEPDVPMRTTAMNGKRDILTELRPALLQAFGHPSSTVRQAASDTWVKIYTTATRTSDASGTIHLDTGVPPIVVDMLTDLVASLKQSVSWQHTEGCLMTAESVTAALALGIMSGDEAGFASSTHVHQFARDVSKATLKLTTSNQFEIRRMLAQLLSPLAWLTTVLNPLSIPQLLEFSFEGEAATAANTYTFAMWRESLCLAQWLEETRNPCSTERKWGLSRLSNAVDEKNFLQKLKATVRDNISREAVQTRLAAVLEVVHPATIAIVPFMADFACRSYEAAPTMGTDIAAALIVFRSFIWSSQHVGQCLKTLGCQMTDQCNTDIFLSIQILHDLRAQTEYFNAQATARKQGEMRQLSLPANAWDRFLEFAAERSSTFPALDSFSDSTCLTECWKCAAKQWPNLPTSRRCNDKGPLAAGSGFHPPIICVGGLVALSMSSQDTLPAMIARDLKLAERMLCEEIASVLPTFAMSLEDCSSPVAPVTLALIVSDWLTDITADPLRGGRRRVRFLQCLCRAISSAACRSLSIDCAGFEFPVSHAWALVGARLALLLTAASFEKGALPDLLEAIVDIIMATRANRTTASTAPLSAALAAYTVESCHQSEHELLHRRTNDDGNDNAEEDNQTWGNVSGHFGRSSSGSDPQLPAQPMNDEDADDPWADWDDDVEDDDDSDVLLQPPDESYSPQSSPFWHSSRQLTSPLTGTPAVSRTQSQAANRHRIHLCLDKLSQMSSDLPFVLLADTDYT